MVFVLKYIVTRGSMRSLLSPTSHLVAVEGKTEKGGKGCKGENQKNVNHRERGGQKYLTIKALKAEMLPTTRAAGRPALRLAAAANMRAPAEPARVSKRRGGVTRMSCVRATASRHVRTLSRRKCMSFPTEKHQEFQNPIEATFNRVQNVFCVLAQ